MQLIYGKKNVRSATVAPRRYEEHATARGELIPVKDDDPILSHAFETVHNETGIEEERAHAQHLLDLALEAVYWQEEQERDSGSHLNTKAPPVILGSRNPDRPIPFYEVKRTQQAYVNARREYTIPATV